MPPLPLRGTAKRAAISPVAAQAKFLYAVAAELASDTPVLAAHLGRAAIRVLSQVQLVQACVYIKRFPRTLNIFGRRVKTIHVVLQCVQKQPKALHRSAVHSLCPKCGCPFAAKGTVRYKLSLPFSKICCIVPPFGYIDTLFSSLTGRKLLFSFIGEGGWQSPRGEVCGWVLAVFTSFSFALTYQ